MGDDHHGAGIFAQVFFKPGDGFGVQVVGRLIEQQQIRLGKQQLAVSATRRFHRLTGFDARIARRAAQRVHRLLHLAFQIPQVLAVDQS
jgi:hypothetical protein